MRIPRPQAPSLASTLDPRRNSLNALRLLFAAMVVIGHGQHVGFDQRPLHVGSMAIHDVAVDGFFIISGYLITGSWLSSSSGGAYLRRRIARIFPGYWVCLLLTAFVVAPLLWVQQHGGLGGFPWVSGSHEPAIGYVWTNLSLFEYQQHIGGLLAGANVPGQMNGSLWTLFYEFGAYLVVMALGAVGLLRLRSRLVPALTFVLLLGSAWYAHDPVGFRTTLHSPLLAGNTVRLGLMFGVGMCLKLWDDRVPMHRGLALLAGAIWVASLPLVDWRLTGAVPFGYLVFWLGAKLPLQGVGQRVDLSYGIYLYGWPILQLYWALGLTSLTEPGYLALALATSAAMAWLSFTLVERPASRWARGRRPQPAPVAPEHADAVAAVSPVASR
jgi:peptidoglycan/LPS O-acetylase OafA/YrhL